jgi:phage-related protein
MLTLSSIVIDQKNDLGSTEAILVAIDLAIPSITEPIRLVRNNENITWRGSEYQAFPFSIDEISETATNEVPSVAITLANASRAIEKYIVEYDIWLKENAHQPIVVTIHVLSTADLANTSSILSSTFEISSFSSNAESVTFNLTQKNLYIKAFPPHKITRKCHFKFGSTECGVITGGTCNKTLANCRSHNNSVRFGGYPSVGGKLDKVYS